MYNFLKMPNICLVLIFCSASLAAVDQRHERFEVFKLRFHKDYKTDAEELERRNIFYKNLKLIEEHNDNYATGLKNFTLEVNEYADWTSEEFQDYMNGHYDRDNGALSEGASYITPANVELPAAVDWRELGAVTAVKKQNKCGSCWAFATTGALEGQHFRKSGKLVSLSEQNLLDCTVFYGNKGCQGGSKERAFLYVRDNGGIDTEDAYPYRAKQSPECLFEYENIGAKSKGFVKIAAEDEQALTAAVATVGPVAVALNGRCLKLQFYQAGIFDDEACDREHLTHAMLIVGYGRDNQTQRAYWIVKNSWGAAWGRDGYVLLPRNINYAGLAKRASFPLV